MLQTKRKSLNAPGNTKTKGIVLKFPHTFNIISSSLLISTKEREKGSEQTHLPSHQHHMSSPIPEIQAAYNKKKGQPEVRS